MSIAIRGLATWRYTTTWTHSTNLSSYEFILCAHDNIALAAALPQTTETAIYVSWESDTSDLSISTPVKYADCVSGGWLTHKSGGAELATPGYSTSRVTLIGDAGYQAAWLAGVRAALAANPGIDGIHIDLIQATLQSYAGGNGENTDYPNEYPSQATWEAAMLSFISTVGPALIADGYKVNANAIKRINTDGRSNNGVFAAQWYTQIAPYVTGITAEFWLQDHSVPDTTYLSHLMSTSHVTYNDHWDGWITLHALCNSLGVKFRPIVRSAPAFDATIASWARANFLLNWDGSTGSVIYTSTALVDPWDVSWTMDVGQPIGPMHSVGVGYRREYSRGVTLVNPHTSISQTFDFGWDYQRSDGSIVSSVTLAAKTGEVLTTINDVLRPTAVASRGGDILQLSSGDLAGLRRE